MGVYIYIKKCRLLSYPSPSSSEKNNQVLFHCAASSPGFMCQSWRRSRSQCIVYYLCCSHLPIKQRELKAAQEIYCYHNSQLILHLSFWRWPENRNCETFYPAPQSHMRVMNLQHPSENLLLLIILSTRKMTVKDTIISDY